MFERLAPVLPKSARCDADGELVIGDVAVSDLAATFGTPLVIYDEDHLVDNAKRYLAAFAASPPSNDGDDTRTARVVFACKSFCSVGMVELMVKNGVGVDVASGGELAIALAAGVAPSEVIFHGNAKSVVELQRAISLGVGIIVIDSPDELDAIERILSTTDVEHPLRVLVRVTPGIETETHQYIRTAHTGSKFGVSPIVARELLTRAQRNPKLDPAGIHIHLGSQLTGLAPWHTMADWLGAYVAELRDIGVAVRILDIGGGLGVPYTPDQIPPTIEEFASEVHTRLKEVWGTLGLPLPQLIVEPGRSIAGSAAITVYKVEVVKDAGDIRYVAVDGGMSDNPRPMLYQAEYSCLLPRRANEIADQTYWVAGKHCESGDVLVEDATLPNVSVGDLLAITTTGAYTISMSSNYNALLRPAIVFVRDGKTRLVVRRETEEDLLRREIGSTESYASNESTAELHAAMQVATERLATLRPNLARSVIAAATGAAALRLGPGDRMSPERLSDAALDLLRSHDDPEV